jgi:hypothetical protein
MGDVKGGTRIVGKTRGNYLFINKLSPSASRHYTGEEEKICTLKFETRIWVLLI